ncbi:hypothetical protein Rhal01_00844 [Rubritalea halochordaticola]|uniref:Uncharacterized protein n=1 Tax=Rubritalea halochordaticola TaxID=714537 RepID=A0ABP9UW39_9BACT
MCTLSLSLIAQDGEPVREPKGKFAYLICTKIPKGGENPVKLLRGTKTEEVSLSLRSASLRVKLPANGKFQLVKLAPTAVGEAGEGMQVIAETQIPKEVREALIILTPTVDAEAKKAGLVFDAHVQDLAKFKGGDSLYVNFTKELIGVHLGESKKMLKPNSSLIIETGATDQPLNTAVSYWRRKAQGEAWDRISSSTIAFYPTRREICFFYPRSNGRIGYRGVTCPVEE